MLRCEICKHKVSDFFYLESHMNQFHDSHQLTKYELENDKLTLDICEGVRCEFLSRCSTCSQEFKCYKVERECEVEISKHSELCGVCSLEGK